MFKTDDSWTLFLDRDGVINKRIWDGYVKETHEFEFLPGIPEAIAELTDLFRYIFVVTNQQGVGKGLMSERNLNEIHRYMRQSIEACGGRITKTYYAPGMASKENQLRKPNPGMAYLAQRQFEGVDFNKSIMVGDTDTDILFGKELGMKTVRILSTEKMRVTADVTIDSLVELKHFLS
jgi:histidinol-phosphate phosphatase family protein